MGRYWPLWGTLTYSSGAFHWLYINPLTCLALCSGSWRQTQKGHHPGQPRWHLHSVLRPRHDWPLHHSHQVWRGWDSLLALPYPCFTNRWCQQVYGDRWELFRARGLRVGEDAGGWASHAESTPRPTQTAFCRAPPAPLHITVGKGICVSCVFFFNCALFCVIFVSLWLPLLFALSPQCRLEVMG